GIRRRPGSVSRRGRRAADQSEFPELCVSGGRGVWDQQQPGPGFRQDDRLRRGADRAVTARPRASHDRPAHLRRHPAAAPAHCEGANMNARKGFTLIELLVTISIMSLLIGILIPSLSAGRERARRVVCQSNLRQINTAIWNYSVSEDGHVPII